MTHKLFDKFTYEYDIALLQVHGDKLDFQVNMAQIQTISDNVRQFPIISHNFTQFQTISDNFTQFQTFSDNFR